MPNFSKEPGYRHTICVSVNDEIVHGIPGSRVIEAGDIVSIDSGAEYDGWNGDAAITVVVPDASRPELVAPAADAQRRHRAVAVRRHRRAVPADRLGEVGAAIEDYIDERGTYGILEDYTGHGIGRSMHEPPAVFNYRVRDLGARVHAGPGRRDRADGDLGWDRNDRAR